MSKLTAEPTTQPAVEPPWRQDLILILSHPPYRGKGGMKKLATDLGVTSTTMTYWCRPRGTTYAQEPNCDNQTRLAELASATRQKYITARPVGGDDVQPQPAVAVQ